MKVFSFLVVLVFSTVAFAQTTQPIQSSGDPSLKDLLKPAGPAVKPLPTSTAPPAIDTTSRTAVAPGTQAQNVLREGSFIVDRTGRLQKGKDGVEMEFVFDSDGKTLKDPPMVILPSLKLMAMENAVSGNSRDLRFRVTGMVTEYRGRNYVLLEKVVVIPDVVQPF